MSTELITQEQLSIANLRKKGIVIIKGIAGSGKTTVGIHRLKFIINHIALEGDSIAYLTYNNTLISYINQIIGAKDLNIGDDGQSMIEIATKSNSTQHIGTVSKLMNEYYFDYIRENGVYANSLESISEKIYFIKQGIKEIENEFENRTIAIFNSKNYNFLIDEIDWIRSSRIGTEKEYQVFDRKGRFNTNGDGRRLPKKSDTRRYIFKLSQKYNKLQWYERKFDFILKDMIALHQIKNNPKKSFEHIIVDECQDLSRIQLDFLKYLLNEKDNASATLLYDPSQSIYPNSWLSSNRPISSLGIKSHSGNTKTLKKNWRTTAEIQKAAISLIEDEPDIKLEKNIEYINRSNTLPVHFRAQNTEEHNQFIVKLIKSKVKTFNKKNIAVTSRTGSGLKQLKRVFDAANIENEIVNKDTTDFNSEKVHLYTMHSIKGLESDIVIMAHLNDGYLPHQKSIEEDNGLIREKRLMYVAMTRARHQLYMVSSTEKPTRFIEDIDPTLIKQVNSDDLDINADERHPKLANEYALFEKLLDDISKFKEKSDNNTIDVINRKEKYNDLFKQLKFAEDKLNKLLETVEIESFDKDELTRIKDQVINNLEYNNFSKYTKENISSHDSYIILKDQLKGKIKNEYRNLKPDEREWIVEMFIKFEDIDSIKTPRHIFMDMFKLFERRIRIKFNRKSITFRDYSISKIIHSDMNIIDWYGIRDDIIKSDIINIRNSIAHDIGDIPIELVLRFKKLLFEDELLKRILKTKFTC